MNPEAEQDLEPDGYFPCLWCEKLGMKRWITYPSICACSNEDHDFELRLLAVDFYRHRLRGWSRPLPPVDLVKVDEPQR